MKNLNSLTNFEVICFFLLLVGSPLDVPRISEPTDEEINEVHSNYVKHLTDLFETHKGNYGISESQHLHII